MDDKTLNEKQCESISKGRTEISGEEIKLKYKHVLLKSAMSKV